MPRLRLGDLLIERGVLTQGQLEQALAFQGEEKSLLGEILLRLGYLKQSDLGEVLADQYGVPFVALEQEEIDPQVPVLLPEAFSREHMVVPFRVSGQTLSVTMAAPDNLWTISEVRLLTGYDVTACVSTASDILRLLDQAFDGRLSTRQTIVDMRMDQLKRGEQLEEAEVQTEESADDADAPVVRLVNSILTGGVASGASDIHFEPQVPEMRIRFRIDGVLYDNMHIPSHIEPALISRLKVMADLDITERRHPQDGHITLDDEDRTYDLRVSTMPTVAGEKLVIRILANDTNMFNLDKMGLSETNREKIDRLVGHPHGMILVTGPTGSGKSTSLYAMLNQLNESSRNIVTLEDPVENQIAGINQIGVDANFGMSFASGLKYILRQDPDVIMIGEIRDGETAEVAVQAALTGHLLLSTLHTNDASGAIARLIDLGVQPFLVASSLVGVVAQRLLRRTCPDCRVPANPAPEELALFGRYAARLREANLFEGKGCDRCFGTGYRGRCAVFELMMMSPTLMELIERRAKAGEIKAQAMREGMQTLVSAGIDKAVAGTTTMDEVRRRVLAYEMDSSDEGAPDGSNTDGTEHEYAVEAK